MKKFLYPFLDLTGSASSVPLRERPNTRPHRLILGFRNHNISLTPLKTKRDTDFDAIELYCDLGNRGLPGPYPVRTTAQSYPYRYCKSNHRFLIPARCKPRITRPGLTTGILEREASHLSGKYDVALTHALENRFLMDYTFVWWGRDHLLFLQLLVVSCGSALQRTVFYLAKRRHLD